MERNISKSKHKSYAPQYVLGTHEDIEHKFGVSEKSQVRRHSKMTESLQRLQSTENFSHRQSILPETKEDRDSSQMSSVSLDIHPLKSYSGLRKQLCQSDNEYKAQKLNKTEESRLQTYKARVEKQQVLFEKEFTKTAYIFRAQSAKYFREPSDKVSCQSMIYTQHSNRTARDRVRPMSSPVYSSRFQHGFQKTANRETTCSTCNKMQNLIVDYERLSADGLGDGGEVHYTRYLFSDRQMRTFINILETNYCVNIPEMMSILNKRFHCLDDVNDTFQQRKNKSEHVIQSRIRKFCKTQDVFNKQHPLPENVKLGLEKSRMAQAVTTRRRASARVSMASEVRMKLGLSNVGITNS